MKRVVHITETEVNASPKAVADLLSLQDLRKVHVVCYATRPRKLVIEGDTMLRFNFQVYNNSEIFARESRKTYDLLQELEEKDIETLPEVLRLCGLEDHFQIVIASPELRKSKDNFGLAQAERLVLTAKEGWSADLMALMKWLR